VSFPGELRWQIDDVEFVYGYRAAASAKRLLIQKTADILTKYEALCAEFRHGAIVELGIAGGGSTALIALLAQPTKLVVCELDAEPVASLAAFIAERELSERVRPYYGVDQSDGARLAAIVAAEFGRGPLDLVVDDASHRYEPTKASFEALYARLRPGGLYVIEDWTADHTNTQRMIGLLADRSAPEFAERERRFAEALTAAGGFDITPIHRLAPELVQVAANSPDVVSAVTVDRHWIAVRRGPAALDPASFRIADHHAEWSWAID
jgi:predicted O-methyltransferase YrrM